MAGINDNNDHGDGENKRRKNIKEELFLKSRQSRLDATNNNTITTSRDPDTDQFWVDFRKCCSLLDHRIDSIRFITKNDDDDEKGPTPRSYVTSSQKNEAISKLNSIKRDIRSLSRIVCLDDQYQHQVQNDEEEEGMMFMIQAPPEELPKADVKRIVETCKKMERLVEDLREWIRPKDRFVFRRYRALLEEKKKNGEVDFAAVLNAKKKEEKEEKGTKNVVELGGGGGLTLEGRKDENLIVEVDGSVTVLEGEMVAFKGRKKAEGLSSSSSSGVPSSSFLVKDLENCQVMLKGKYNSLQIINIRSSTLILHHPINGPIHITNAHSSSKLYASSDQLRIHESSDLECHVHVSSGPILEGCQNIRFHGDYYIDDDDDGNNMFRSVKDFDWLRTLIKSPNFEIVEKIDKEEKKGDGSITAETSIKSSSSSPVEQKNDDDENCSSDEDEL